MLVFDGGITYKDGKQHGLRYNYYEDGELKSKYCLKNGDYTDMSYCEK